MVKKHKPSIDAHQLIGELTAEQVFALRDLKPSGRWLSAADNFHIKDVTDALNIGRREPLTVDQVRAAFNTDKKIDLISVNEFNKALPKNVAGSLGYYVVSEDGAYQRHIDQGRKKLSADGFYDSKLSAEAKEELKKLKDVGGFLHKEFDAEAVAKAVNKGRDSKAITKQELLDALDLDKDGTLSRRELKVAMGKLDFGTDPVKPASTPKHHNQSPRGKSV